jgi:hypothetical protein
MSITFDIKVTLPVFKALTARLEEGMTHDDVLRDLLSIDSIIEPERDEIVAGLSKVAEGFQEALHQQSGKGGFFSRGLWLPNGTRLRARYKQREFIAGITDNAWIDERGKRHTSPSAAATAITGTNVNGLRFWEAKRPGDGAWRRLDLLVQQ